MRWIITDVDGCLTPEESVPWELDLFFEFARLVRAANEGHGTLAPMTLCTGRPQPYAEVLMKMFDVRAPAVCENGAVLYSLARNLARYGPGITRQKMDGMRAVREFIEHEILPQYGGGAQMPEAAAPELEADAAADPALRAPKTPGALLQFGKEAQISVFSEFPENFKAIKPRIEEFTRQRGGPELIINDSHCYLNISLKGVDKGAALRAVLDELDCPREMSAGIGDTEGDLPLRDAVGWFACPANARDAIKAVADYVSPFPTIRGMLDILQRPELQRA